jgi:hypothetical protein
MESKADFCCTCCDTDHFFADHCQMEEAVELRILKVERSLRDLWDRQHRDTLEVYQRLINLERNCKLLQISAQLHVLDGAARKVAPLKRQRRHDTSPSQTSSSDEEQADSEGDRTV